MKITYLAILLLIATTITQPIIQATDITRHPDPATLPQENPDPDKLFNLYYKIFHETAVENFTGANMWLDWASKIEALPNLKPTLQTYYITTKSEITLISETRSLLNDTQIMLKRLDPNTLTAIKNARTILNEATKTLNNIDSQSQTLGITLQYPTTKLDNGVEELKRLLNTYNAQLNSYEHEFTIDFNSNKPKLLIVTDKTEVTPGEIILIQGNLHDVNGTALPGRKITIYFDDTKITTTFTTELGGIKAEFITPYLYKDNATIYAEYKPEGGDAAKYGRKISNIITVKILWIQPTLSIQAPNEAYPGMELRVTGLLSHMNVGLVGVSVNVTTLGETFTKETSRKGSITTSMIVPENYPEGTQQVEVKSKAAGIYGPASVKQSIAITRYPSTLIIDATGWILVGQKLSVNGKVESANQSMQDTLIELRSDTGKNTINVNTDGTFKTEIQLPQTLLTSTYTYQAVSHSNPWIREASANGSVLVINPITLLLVLGLVGTFTYQVSKRVRLKPRAKETLKLPTRIETTPHKPSQEASTVRFTEPDNPKDLFWWTATQILSKFNVALGKNMTIREWLNALKEKTDTPLYTLIERVGLQYERSLYGKSRKDEQETKTLFQRIKELLR